MAGWRYGICDDAWPPSHNGRIAVEMNGRDERDDRNDRASCFPAVFGLVLVLAGLTALGYIPTNLTGETLFSVAMALLVPGVLMLSAFYMAFRFLRFAVSGKK